MKAKVRLLFQQLLLLSILISFSFFLFNTDFFSVQNNPIIDKIPNQLPISSESSAEVGAEENQSNVIQKSDHLNLNKPTVDLTVWNLILVNEHHPLEAELIENVSVKELPNGMKVDKRIYDPLTEMLQKANNMGYNLMVCSGYRSYAKQKTLLDANIRREINSGKTQEQAYSIAKTSVAIPGTSEHHTGLAVDIVSERYQTLDEGMFSLPEIQWLYQNCYKYGFIVRYPTNKSDITGIIHEPWHYRYVGIEAATYIMENKLTLEEYWEMFQS